MRTWGRSKAETEARPRRRTAAKMLDMVRTMSDFLWMCESGVHELFIQVRGPAFQKSHNSRSEHRDLTFYIWDVVHSLTLKESSQAPNAHRYRFIACLGSRITTHFLYERQPPAEPAFVVIFKRGLFAFWHCFLAAATSSCSL